ncbi:hypothetical protein [Pseudoalteromonas byunsanensis]|uniref:Uncharacterized protein n=1 Tax=Pseudoalteromonas byunsanensis TaxID=327939 RepID=A0A1S1N9T6_9GAMM|nr:hypothetical protein [Pseudoalteromonas byunsanensis]OHU96126.1 hypothetical protein BIW53_06155 [Pseudoalteromonas byunsanensis]
MYKQAIVLLLCGLSIGCSESVTKTIERQNAQASQQTDTFINLLKSFDKQAQQLLESLKIGADVRVIQKHSDALSIQAQTIVALFVELQPQCSDYVARLLPLSNSLQSLPYEAIQSQVAQNEQLSQFEHPLCYHVKDLLIQPIMLSAWTKKGVLEEAEYRLASESMVELIAHLSLVQTITIKRAHSPEYS